MRIAHLGRPDGDPDGFAALRAEFRDRNPHHDVRHARDVAELTGRDRATIVFIQNGSGAASVGRETRKVSRGDVVVLRPDQVVRFDARMEAVVFGTPEELPPEVPTFLLPDADPRINDTPGGCATDDGAYRRVILTWEGRNGPYVYHALNTHRVRMTDSFSHYHPRERGFDEMYLVQAVSPGGHVLTSDRVDRIESPETVTAEEARTLVTRSDVAVGDLLYSARGEVHRAVGGVLAHVITTPGFLTGAEIGVDHHLRAINERLGLEGDDALPFHEAASLRPVIK